MFYDTWFSSLFRNSISLKTVKVITTEKVAASNTTTLPLMLTNKNKNIYNADKFDCFRSVYWINLIVLSLKIR